MAGAARRVIRGAAWVCAVNLLAGWAGAQCSDPALNIPAAAYLTGDHSYSGFPTVTNPANTAPVTSTAQPGFQLSNGATATFSAPNCIHLSQGFSAQATGGTLFNAWVSAGPEAVSVSPSASTGASALFSFTVQEPSGLANLQAMYLLFNTSASGSNACYIQYNPNSGILSLYNDQAGAWQGFPWYQAGGSALNTNCAIYNSYNGLVASVVPTGNQITVNVPVVFQQPHGGYAGELNQYVSASDNQGWSTGFLQMGTWIAGISSGFTPIRISAGGPYTDSLGQVWSADTAYAQNGGLYTPPATPAIVGTPDQKLYQTERYSAPTLNYQFAVPNGNYAVTLKFAEIYDTGPGQRYMNVLINNVIVSFDLDVWTMAGGPDRAYDLTFPTTVNTGRLTVALTCLPSGHGAYTWSLDSGTLPPGLRLSGSTLPSRSSSTRRSIRWSTRTTYR